MSRILTAHLWHRPGGGVWLTWPPYIGILAATRDEAEAIFHREHPEIKNILLVDHGTDLIDEKERANAVPPD